MKPTGTSRALKYLFAGYHEPAPLSKQQSQRLLNGLKSSFRDQLDREYGRSSRSQPTTSEPSNSADAAAPIAREPAVNHHLKTILSNPLFSYKPGAKSPLPPPMLSSKKDPMEVFDHAVARGMMTLKAATGCLLAKRHQMHLASDISSAPENTDTGLRVLRWLRSSRPASDLSFLANGAFVSALFPFLVEEGLEHVVCEWAVRVVDGDASAGSTPDDGKRCAHAADLLQRLVKIQCQAQPHGNLDGAITTLLEAQKSLSSPRLLSQTLFPPWRLVSWFSTVESYDRATASEKLFDAHMATGHRLRSRIDVPNAHLCLYHPTSPDATAALRFFDDKEKVRTLMQKDSAKETASSRYRMGLLQWVAVLGHDTVSFLTRSGRVQEAERVKWLMDWELSSLPSHTLEPA